MAIAGRFISGNALNYWIIAILAISTALLFWGGPDYASPRSYKHLSDLGHILYFALATYLLLEWPGFSHRSWLNQWTLALSLTLLIGVLIEVVQSAAQRSPDLGDIVRDLTGSILVLSFYPRQIPNSPKKFRTTLQVAAIFCLLVQLWPLMLSLFDEAVSRRQFPVLTDFESPFEIDRWRGNKKLSVDNAPQPSIGKALRVTLTTEKYSGISLKYFPGDWRHFKTLRMNLYNPQAEPLWMTCRIHDMQHTKGERKYADRFNRRYLLVTGWNEIEIDLHEVASAPKGRSMDLSQIRGLGIFAASLPKPRVIYVDDVRLER